FYYRKLFLQPVLSSQWKVEYPQLNICAMKGSSVVIPCSFHHPDNLRPEKVIWGHVKYHRKKAHLIFVGFVKSRFKYIGDSYKNCSLKIHQVDCMDTGKYGIKFIYNNTKRFPAATSSPTLKIKDLKVELKGNKTIKEGGSVNLTCINSCDGEVSSAFVWFKNGEPVNDGAVLYLSNVSHTSSGNYTCSLKTHTRAISGFLSDSPKNTSASISPSADTDAHITLVCHSHANPPVEAYTWFKSAEGGSVVVGHEPVFSPGDSGRYFCSVTNKHGNQNSSIVTVNIKGSVYVDCCSFSLGLCHSVMKSVIKITVTSNQKHLLI
uniref:B-cell receptor CD22-like n=1 Tax=Sphaeramia orbicularis TaxID=375764 RepID=A0A672YIL0_9TELE